MATILPVCTDIPSKPFLPLFTDSHPVFLFHLGDATTVYSVHREHIGFFDRECRSDDARTFEQLMFAYASKYVEGAASVAAAAGKGTKDKEGTKDDGAKKDKVAVTFDGICKMLGVDPASPDLSRTVLGAAIEHATKTNAAAKVHINDQVNPEDMAEFKKQWKNLAWVLLVTAAEKLTEKLAPLEDQPLLHAVCNMLMGACEAKFLARETVAWLFKPLLVPVRIMNTKKRLGFVGADIYKGLKTQPAMTWSAPSDATSGCCDFETWMTYMGPFSPHYFNRNGRPTLAEESVYTLAQSPHYVASVQNHMEAALVKSSGFGYGTLNFKYDKENLYDMGLIIYTGLMQDLNLARQSNNIVWLRDMKHNFFEPAEFNLPDGVVPPSPKTGKSWGKATYYQIKGIPGPDGQTHSWQSVELHSGNQARLHESLQFLAKTATTALGGAANKLFTTKFSDKVERSVTMAGVMTQASFNACSEKGMFLEGKDEYKITDVTPETLKVLKYKLGVRLENTPSSLLSACMVFKFAACAEYLHLLFPALRGAGDCGVPIQAYEDLSHLRTDGQEFRCVELRDMVAGIERASFEAICAVSPKDDTNAAACTGFTGFVPRTTGVRCAMVKPAPANASAASVSKPDMYDWCEKIVAKTPPARRDALPRRIQELAEIKMYTLVTSAMAGSAKALVYQRPAVYTMTGVPIGYESFLDDKYKKAPCFPRVSFDFFCGAGQNAKKYMRCTWPDERGQGGRQGPVLTLMNPKSVFSQTYLEGSAGESGVQQLQLSDRIQDAVMILQQNRSVGDEDLEDYGLDEDSKKMVVELLKQAGVEYKGSELRDARLAKKRAAEDEEEDDEEGVEGSGSSRPAKAAKTSSYPNLFNKGGTSVPPADSASLFSVSNGKKAAAKSGGDFLDSFLDNM
ncbi:protein ORF88 [Cyprinid herpesvirus 3]|nr:protein ORF88 [Cyprinid herpesvirus 3]AOO32809.1 protein ORF88 [Cyprinid herpesvirus 3]AOO32966.1 protein ORF88 [Cyprinid herpesvirus 3]AOO33121.1 protein ORF88 [Cyprinid herpesvirus 3]AOO33436.1 protein ORF88 [Cyprinid herpesvirus 3]